MLGSLNLGAVHHDAVDAVVVVGLVIGVPAAAVDALGAGFLAAAGVGAVGAPEAVIFAAAVFFNRNLSQRLGSSSRLGLDVRREEGLPERRDEIGHLPHALL